MRRGGIVHGELMARINALRHTDVFVVSDAGLPVPAGIPVVDLAVTLGLPRFMPVLGAILAEVVVERSIVADELAARNAEVSTELAGLLGRAGAVPSTVPHEEFKRLVAEARFVVRTGEATPYANVLLHAGVAF